MQHAFKVQNQTGSDQEQQGVDEKRAKRLESKKRSAQKRKRLEEEGLYVPKLRMTKKNLTAEDYQEIDTLRNANKKAPRNATAGPSTNHDSPMELLIDPYLLTISTPSFDADDDVPCSDETDPSRAMAPVAVENTPASATDTGASATSCDLTKAEGVVFPQRAETVDWADGHKTYLPWISDERDPSKNKLEKEASHVRSLAQTARPAAESSFITHLEYGDYPTEIKLTQRIHEEIAKGNPVILRGYPDSSAIQMNQQSLEDRLGILPNQEFDALDAVKRFTEDTDYHIRLTLEDFCKGLDDESRIQCVLDCPTVDGWCPSFVKHLDQGHTAWYRLHEQFKDRRYIPLDVQKSRSWALLHQALFHTYAHHDANGYGTWTLVASGHKIWVFLRPRISSTASFDKCQNRQQYDELVSKYLEDSPEKDVKTPYYGEESERFFVVAKSGDIIIQPPATPHEVYTPTPSVTLGGHFMAYDSLHLTEVARYYDVATGGKFTNQDHASSTDTVCMMMCHLADIPNARLHKKALTALCTMVISPKLYTSPQALKQQGKAKSDVSKAVRMAKDLQKKLQLHVQRHPKKHFLSDLENDFVFMDGNWMDPGEVIDAEPVLRSFRVTKI